MGTKGIFVFLLLLCAIAALCLCACSKPAPTTGNTVDLTDPDAPTVIESCEITEFYASFFHRDCESEEGKHEFSFRIAKGEGGLTVAEEVSARSVPADEALLLRLQQIIEEEELAALNGQHRYTAGLAPECSEREFTVTYASGEVLTFTLNNDPDAVWTKRMYTVFSEWFTAQGESIFPAPLK